MDVLSKVTYEGGTAVYTPFPTPKEISYTLSTLDSSSSGRNQRGVMFRDVVADKRKIQVKWGALDNEQCAALLQLVDDATFDLRFPDAHTGQMETMTCYVGDRQSPIMIMTSDNVWRWQGVSFSFIEV